MRKYAHLLLPIILVGCGGGGSESESNLNVSAQSSAPANPKLTASISRSNLLIDEEFLLDWSSTQTSKCTVEAAKSYEVGSSGKLTLTYQSAGTKNIKISCAANSSTLTETFKVEVSAASTYSVHVDTSKINYYHGYITPTKNSADLEVDKCDLDTSVITYPKEYMGDRVLPTLTESPINSNMGRLIYIKDAMGKNNPSEVPGCTGDLKKELVDTLHRIKALGADWVALPQWQWLGEREDGSWYIMTTEESSNGGARLNDEEFAFTVKEAKSLGLKVYTWNQIQGMSDNKSHQTQPEYSRKNLEKWFSAYHAHMIRRAEFFQSVGVDLWELSCGGCIQLQLEDTGDPERTEYMRQQYIKITKDITSRYKGKLTSISFSWLDRTPEVLNEIDYIATGFWSQHDITEAEEATITVEQLKNFYRPSINHIKNSAHGKPLFLATGIFSRKTALSDSDEPYIDEYCDANQCKAPEWKADFALQAIYHKAVFELIKEMNLKDNSMVGVADMFVGEQVMPHFMYPNVMMSIRNKPAEGIVKHYFQK